MGALLFVKLNQVSFAIPMCRLQSALSNAKSKTVNPAQASTRLQIKEFVPNVLILSFFQTIFAHFVETVFSTKPNSATTETPKTTTAVPQNAESSPHQATPAIPPKTPQSVTSVETASSLSMKTAMTVTLQTTKDASGTVWGS